MDRIIKNKGITAFLLSIVVMMTSIPVFAVETAAAEAVSEIYVSPEGSDKSGDGSKEIPFQSVQKAYDESEKNGKIILSGTVVIDDYMDILKFSQEKNIELSGSAGGCIIYDGDQNIDPSSAILKVTAGNVVLEDITLKMPDQRGKNGRVLYVSDTGNVTIGSGTVIENGYLSASSGNIYIGDGGRAVLDGGIVRKGYLAITNADAFGAGVFVDTGGSFVMKSGQITDNTARATVSSYRTFGGGAAVMNGGRFEMSGGKISGNRAETGGGGLYLQQGAEAVFYTGKTSGSGVENGPMIRGNHLMKPISADEENNVYFAEKATAFLSGSMAGADIGVTCEDDYYGRIVFVPFGSNVISGTDEESFLYDDGTYDIRLDSFTKKQGNLILWYWMVGVDVGGRGVTAENTAKETPRERDYDNVIIPEEGYLLPDEIQVEIGGEMLEPDHYVWNSETGEVHIDGEYVTDDIVIRVNGDKGHVVTVSCSHVSADIASVTVIEKDRTEIHFTRERKYGLPKESGIQVEGDCVFTYDSSTGVLVVEDVKEAVEIHAEGSEIPHTITFDPNGGILKPGEETKEFLESDPTLGKLPVPEKEGYHFDGWFTPDGKHITENTPNDNEDDIILKAKWSAKTDISYEIRHFIEKTDSGVNPKSDSSDPAAVSVKDGAGTERIYYLYGSVQYEDGIADSVQTLNDRLMDNHRINMNDLSIDGFVLADFNEYEHKIEPDGSTVVNWYYNRKDIRIRYDGNGGTTSQAETSVKYGSHFGMLASAQRAGYTFDGWYTDPRGGEKVTPDGPCRKTEDFTLYAHWKAQGDTPYTVIHKTQNLKNNTVDASHTDENTTLLQKEILYGTSDTTVDLYAMAAEGFRPCPDNRYQIYINADGSASAVLYYDRLSAVVIYDANGGIPSADGDMRTKVWYGGVLGAVQTPPARTGYTFTGWYTAKEGGAKVDEKTGYDIVAPKGQELVTVYAHWRENPKPPEPKPEPDKGGGSGGTTPPIKEPLLTKDHIRYLWGYPDGTFQAEQYMTRAEAAQMFFNLLNKPWKGNSSFKDVAPSDWFAQAAGALSRLGIIHGYSDGTFQPNQAVTRAEFVMMASRFFEMDPAGDAKFSDVSEESWYYQVIASAAEAGWITGYPDGTFRPKEKISRGEVAAVTNRVLKRKADQTYLESEGKSRIITFVDLPESHWAYYDVTEAANAHDYHMEKNQEIWIELKSA